MKLFGRTEFDFKGIKDVDDATVEAFINATHEGSRRMPLLIAAHVYAGLENELTTPGKMDAMHAAELRGGMMALRAFATLYEGGIREWRKRKPAKEG